MRSFQLPLQERNYNDEGISHHKVLLYIICVLPRLILTFAVTWEVSEYSN